MQFLLENGQMRECHTDKFRRTTIVNPEIDRGRPPRELTMRDFISPRVIDTHGTWNFGDMLSRDSIANLWMVYNAITEDHSTKLARKRKPHKQA